MKCKASSFQYYFQMPVHEFDLSTNVFKFFCIFVNEKEKNYHVRLQLFLGESKSGSTANNHHIIALD
jgi:hypothetical protein